MGRLLTFSRLRLPAAIMAATVGYTVVAAAEPPRLSQADANNACARLAGALISNSEKRYSSDTMREWRFKCEHHPDAKTCRDTQSAVAMVREDVRALECGQPVIEVASPLLPEPKSGPQADPNLRKFNEACARYAGVVLSNSESRDRERTLRWKSDCEHHPDRGTCEDARRAIMTRRATSSLKCGQ